MVLSEIKAAYLWTRIRK